MKKCNKTNKIFSIVSAIFSLLLVTLLVVLNVVPMKYLIPVALVLLVINGINVIMSFRLRLKKKTKVILILLSIIVSLISVLASIYLFKTIVFMNNFNFKGYTSENYSVIVLKSKNYEGIEDLQNKKIGLLKNNEKKEKILDKLNEKIKLELVEEEDTFSLKEELYDENLDAIVIEDSYKNILSEEDKDFENKIKVIYTFSIQYKVENISKNVDVAGDTFTVYIAGIDTYGSVSSVSRSDVNILATVSPKTNQVLLTSIPRDYYVKLYNKEGYNDKLTHAGIYGVDTSVKTLEDLLDVEINYYVRVNFTSIIKLVDALEGVDVYSEYEFNSNDGSNKDKQYHFYKGYNHLDGEQALAFARTRKAFLDGDRARGRNQQALIEGLIRKVASPKIITNYSSILDSLEGSFETNMGTKDITELAKYQIDKMPNWNVTSNSLNGRDGYEYTYSFRGQKLYVMLPDEESVNTAKELLNAIYNDEKLESSYKEEVQNVRNPGESNIVRQPSQPEINKEEPNNLGEESNILPQEITPENNKSNEVLDDYIEDIIGE